MKSIKAQKFIILFFVLLLSQITFAQEFLISDLASVNFSLDRRARVIYLDHLFSDAVFSYDLNTNKLDTTDFQRLPHFANKNYWAYISNYGFIDFENDTTLKFENLDDFTGAHFSFSPNDLGFIGKSGDKYSYYSIPEKKLFPSIPNDVGWENPPPCWSSDTTMMFQTIDKTTIIDVKLKTGEVDTVLKSKIEYDLIVGFEYSPGDDFLLYVNSEFDWQRIWKYYLDGREREVFYDFDTENPESHCRGSDFGFEFLQWSPNKKKMAFVGFFYTISASSIYCHFTDSNKTYLYGICDEYGLKYDVEWLDNDTIIYNNATEARIYGYDLTSPITSVKNSEILPTEYLSIQNYPNPFNPSTVIGYQISVNSKVSLKIYDILGREVAVLVNEYQPAGNYEIEFNAKGLSSGVYYYRIESGNYSNTKKMILLK